MRSVHYAWILLACVGACQTPPPADATDASDSESQESPGFEGDEAQTSEPGWGDAEGDSGDADVREPAAPPDEEAAPASPVTDLAVVAACKKLCERVEQSCDEAALRRCRGSCKKYIEDSGGCGEEYRLAIECQTKAGKAELCGNVAATQCMDQFQEVKRCKRGEKAKSAPDKSLPEGWETITDDKLKFSIALPAGAALDPQAERRTWRVQDGTVEYLVVQLPAPKKPITSKVLLQLVLDLVGYRCQKNLKLHGQFEVGDEAAILFDSSCNDGTEWHGMLRARPDQAVATAFRGSGGVRDKYFYSYKRLSN